MLIINATTETKNQTYIIKTLIPISSGKRARLMARLISKQTKEKLRLTTLKKILTSKYIVAPFIKRRGPKIIGIDSRTKIIKKIIVNYIHTTIEQLKRDISLSEHALKHKKYKMRSINITEEIIEKEYTKIHNLATQILETTEFMLNDIKAKRECIYNTAAIIGTKYEANENIYNKKICSRNIACYMKMMQLSRQEYIYVELYHLACHCLRKDTIYETSHLAQILKLYARHAVKKSNLCVTRLGQISQSQDVNKKFTKQLVCTEDWSVTDHLTRLKPLLDCQETIKLMLSGQLISERCRLKLLETFIIDYSRDCIVQKYEHDIVNIVSKQMSESEFVQFHSESKNFNDLTSKQDFHTACIKAAIYYNDLNDINTDDELWK